MSNPHYTQCPNCKAIYPLPSAKLNDPKARAKCGCCQQIFLLNDNRVADTPTPTNATTEKIPTPVVAQKANTPSSDTVIGDTLIDDGGDTTNKTASVHFSDDELNDFLNKEITVAKDAIQTTRDDKEDETWLQELLSDSSSSPEPPSQPASDDTKINEIDLVTIIPVATTTAQKNKKNTLHKVFSNKPTSQQLATKKPIGVQIMWFVGCVILLALLAVQYAIFNLDTLVKNPSYASGIQRFCHFAKCSIPSANLANIVVDATLKNHPQATDIIITIHNKSDEEQLYPNLLVHLKNKDGTVIADFIASRYDYLSESQKNILGKQSKRIMLTAQTNKMPTTVEVTPFY